MGRGLTEAIRLQPASREGILSECLKNPKISSRVMDQTTPQTFSTKREMVNFITLNGNQFSLLSHQKCKLRQHLRDSLTDTKLAKKKEAKHSASKDLGRPVHLDMRRSTRQDGAFTAISLMTRGQESQTHVYIALARKHGSLS